MKKQKFFMISSEILPEAIMKTAKAKEILAKGEAETVNEAAELAGISRSAFYKYKDGIFPLYRDSHNKIVTISLDLEHKSGVLSKVLNSVAAEGGNILTINQGLPLQGLANVTLSIETTEMNVTTEDLLNTLGDISGLKNLKVIGQSSQI
ncbi:chorismate mutase [Desulfitispora alkaliphila]|uniref:ACT domain-containing protein n=1 Tax=Desulfitispora alkaliphila TaxID=622674 RepID=UPI003D2374FC